MNILMVDDEPFVFEQLDFLIKPLCPMCHLYTAGDSSQALELGRKIDFQLAFLDIELPGKSGLEMAEELKATNPQMDVIILTAHQDFNYAQQSIKIGVAAYITKPIIEEDIVEIMNRFAKQHHANEYSNIITSSLEIISQRYQEKLSLSDLASAIHVNTSYLSRRFKQETGLSFSDYLNHYRLEMAKQMLITHQNYSISEIAERAGYNSLHYFSSSFKKTVGMSPKHYQQQSKESKLK